MDKPDQLFKAFADETRVRHVHTKVSGWIETLTVMITAYATLEMAIEATKRGAHDVLPKPFTPDDLEKFVLLQGISDHNRFFSTASTNGSGLKLFRNNRICQSNSAIIGSFGRIASCLGSTR